MHVRSKRPVIAQTIQASMHFRAFQEKNRGRAFLLGKYIELFSMPILVLIPENWDLKKLVKDIFVVGENKSPPLRNFLFLHIKEHAALDNQF